MVTSFRVFPVLPLRARWIARITEFEWNHYFADVREQGPFKNWRHTNFSRKRVQELPERSSAT
jgi:ligand-binding SRPBCC domain-containing protein